MNRRWFLKLFGLAPLADIDLKLEKREKPPARLGCGNLLGWPVRAYFGTRVIGTTSGKRCGDSFLVFVAYGLFTQAIGLCTQCQEKMEKYGQSTSSK